jgi:hypothetical protein
MSQISSVYFSLQTLVLSALAAVAFADNPDPYAPPPPAYRPPAPYNPPSYKPSPYKEEKLPPQPFAYQYGVRDDYTGADFDKKEEQDAYGNLQGEYRVNLPDGRVQIVTYTADAANGFVADVRYEGEAVYPPEPKGGYGPYKPEPKYAPAPPKYNPPPPPPKYAPAPPQYAPAPSPSYS